MSGTSSTPDGLWRRIADAAETMAGEQSSTNENIVGYMLRTAEAFEAIGPITGGGGGGGGTGGVLPPTITPYAASATAAATDAGNIAVFNSASSVTYTVPPHSAVPLPVGAELPFLQLGAGSVTLVAGAGVTIHSIAGLTLSGQFAIGSAQQIAIDEWVFYGDIKVPDALLAGNNLAELTDVNEAWSNLGIASGAALIADTDGLLAANDDVHVPTQKAVKSYVDSHTVAGPTIDLDGGDATGVGTINIDLDGGTA